jgi:hypothetical protein
MRTTRHLCAAIVLTSLVGLAACGSAGSAGPTGAPQDVITQALDVTLAQTTARIKINSPAAAAQGVVDFRSRSGRLTVSATELTKPADLLIAASVGYLKRASDPGYLNVGATVPAALSGGDPFAGLDLIRGTVHILSDGGGEVDGLSTIRYTLTIDPGQALSTTPPDRQASLRQLLGGRTSTFPIDVWIDSKLLVRRVEVPTDLKLTTPATRVDRMPIATDVDYTAFGVPVPSVQPPTTALSS